MTVSATFNRIHFIPIVVALLAVLVGYHHLFFGGDFFVHQDQYMVSNYSYGNSIGNGWRPDKGFGMSFFYGDPSWHPWGFFSLWERLFPSQRLAHSFFVVMSSLLASLSSYVLLRKVAPNAGCWSILLCPLVVFSSAMAGIYYLRFGISTVVSSLAMLILYKYYEKPGIDYILIAYFILILWVSIVFGSILVLSGLLSLCFVFSVTFFVYYKIEIKQFILKLGIIYSGGILLAVLLAFWLFYSSLIEISITDYCRAKSNAGIELNFLPNIGRLMSFGVSFFQVDWFPHDISMPGLPSFIHRSFNVAAVFPLLLLLFLFRRSTSFWEYSFKIIIVVFLVNALMMSLPLYKSLWGIISEKSKHLIDMYGVQYLPQIGLIAICLFVIPGVGTESQKWVGRVAQRAVAIPMFMFYSCLAIFTCFVILKPHLVSNAIAWALEPFGGEGISAVQKGSLESVVYDVVSYVREGFHWYSFLFYLLNAGFMVLFLKRGWSKAFNRKPVLTGLMLLTNSILMVWTVYPLNTEKMVWEDAVTAALPEFEPYDRFYYCRYDFDKDEKGLKRLNSRIEMYGSAGEFLDANYGRHGYEISPGLNLHGHRSFAPKQEAEYIMEAFNRNGAKKLKDIRSLGRGPLISSALLDMGAVKYYYTRGEDLGEVGYLKPVFESKRLNIYENHNAWPYYYLATHLAIKDPSKHIGNPKPGTAYLSEKDFYIPDENAGKSMLSLKEFAYGKMIFEFDGSNEELLVIADSWHPFWKAVAGDKRLEIVKTNEIFKGIKLPPGKYTVTLYFDTSPYLPGVYITIVAWILFLSAGIWLYAGKKKKTKVAAVL